MQDMYTTSRPVVVRHARDLCCPLCGSPVYRVPRRWVDVLLSSFHPLRRYHCRSMICSWEGNLRAPPPAEPTQGGQHASYDAGRSVLEPSLMGSPDHPAAGDAAHRSPPAR